VDFGQGWVIKIRSDGGKVRELGGDGGLVDIVADADAEAGDEAGVLAARWR
jgi:hypothetical protein